LQWPASASEGTLRRARQPGRTATLAEQAGRAEVGGTVDDPGMALGAAQAVIVGHIRLAGQAQGLDQVEMHGGLRVRVRLGCSVQHRP
jgi:hypothetical protein